MRRSVVYNVLHVVVAPMCLYYTHHSIDNENAMFLFFIHYGPFANLFSFNVLFLNRDIGLFWRKLFLEGVSQYKGIQVKLYKYVATEQFTLHFHYPVGCSRFRFTPLLSTLHIL